MKKFRRRMVFDQLADTAAVNHYLSRCHGLVKKPSKKEIFRRIHCTNNPTFKQPTDCKTGFFNVLKKIWINCTPGNGISTRQLCSILSTKSLAMTLRRLEGAKLICRGEGTGVIKWKMTDFGYQYFRALVHEFVVEPNVELTSSSSFDIISTN